MDLCSSGGTFFTLRCYLDDQPIFLGRNGRISVFTSERALARYLADGSLDAYYEWGVNAWDVAAGTLVIQEAGGVVIGRDGGPASKELTVGGNRQIADALLDLVSHVYPSASKVV